jgi:uncharacterized Zn finger protein
MTKRRSDYDDDYGWGFFPKSKPIKPADGIKSKSQRGAFGESWWAKRWIQVLESYGIGTRLQRGRSYARGGQVLDITIGAGSVTARVQGSRPSPYRITIALPVLSDAEWEKAIDAMSAQAIFAAKLLAGEMPQEIEEAFNTAKVPLFPAKANQLKTACSCPDFANPCKHIAAVYYLLGEQFDADPFLIFTLRGRTRDQIMEALRARRAASVGEADSETQAMPVEKVPPLDGSLETFWGAGDLNAPAGHVAAPDIPLSLLRRLGKSPAGTQETLTAVYQAMTDFALKKVLGEV